MKPILLLTLLAIMPFWSHSTNNDSIADSQNWIYLDYMLRGTVPFKNIDAPAQIDYKIWKDDVKITIGGSYNHNDSIELSHIIRSFDQAIPNRKVKWSENKNANLIIFFTELNISPVSSKKYIIEPNMFGYSMKKPSLILNHYINIGESLNTTVYILNETNEGNRKKLLWQAVGKSLFNSNKGFGFQVGKLSVLGGELDNLSDFDIFLYKTVYSPNFQTNYLNYIKTQYNSLDRFKYLADSNTKYSISMTLFLIIFLLSIFYLYKFVWVKYFDKRIKGSFARFQVSGLIFFLPQLLLAPFFFIDEILKLHHVLQTFITYLIFGTIIVLFFFVLYFVCSVYVYFIEYVLFRNVQKFKKRQALRIVSVSTLMLGYILLNLSVNQPEILMDLNIFLLFLGFLLIIITRFLYFYDKHQKEIINKHQRLKFNKLEQLQTKFQLDAIQARTNPHFLHNSLNTIASLTRQDAIKAEEFALKLSKLFRLRLSEKLATVIPLSKEIETIKLYLEIEEERFFDRFEYSIKVPQEINNINIPSDLLLHLVENSIKHGISKQIEKGILIIEIEKIEKQLLIKVFDNGPDFPDTPIYGTGLKSLFEKLDILYPNKYEFTIFNKPNKHVEIILK